MVDGLKGNLPQVSWVINSIILLSVLKHSILTNECINFMLWYLVSDKTIQLLSYWFPRMIIIIITPLYNIFIAHHCCLHGPFGFGSFPYNNNNISSRINKWGHFVVESNNKQGSSSVTTRRAGLVMWCGQFNRSICPEWDRNFVTTKRLQMVRGELKSRQSKSQSSLLSLW